MRCLVFTVPLMSINQTIESCIKGDRKAQYLLYKSLYTRHMGMCLRYRKDKDSATVSFNNGFVKVLDGLPKLKDLAVFEGWVKRILINQMITEITRDRKYNERYKEYDDIEMNTKTIVLNTGSENLNADYLQDMIYKLPTMTRTVFNLFAIEGYGHKEIGKMLGISEGTSKWHVAEARKRLQALLKPVPQTNEPLKAVQ
ncbi:MAG: RNA polymerase subunit sigma-24 [Bacteroidetes bacterium]|nr:MAG: RNA polymerase subunit sigma-24 [Bacteroidota bacterium]